MLGRRYTLRDQLGRGGMAVVWRAHDSVLGRDVAVKVLAGKHAGDPVSRRRIRDEARAAAALSHPNIAQVHDYGESEYDGVITPYVVMELIPGVTLHERLARAPLPVSEAMRIGAEVAAALAAAHADGLVHRDIKPANVMVTPAGAAKVVDFGIAAAAETEADPAELFGTPAYLAPERLLGGVVEPASDVYALGVLIYRMLSGHSPWTADTTTQMLSAHIYVEPEPLPPRTGVPDYVTALCNRCLAKDPTMRPSARDAAEVLARGAGARVVVAPAAVSEADAETGTETGTETATETGTAPAPAARRRRWPVVVAAALVVVAMIASVWALSGRRDNPRGPAWAGSAPVAPSPSPATGAPAEPAADTLPSQQAPPAKPVAVPATLPAPRPQVPARSRPPAPTSRPPTTSAAPPPGRFTFSSDGGTVVATCTAAAKAQLISATPAGGYAVTKIKSGPAGVTYAVFRDGSAKVRMTVICRKGTPREATTGDG